MNPPYKIFPIGDAAASIDLGNIIDEGLNRKAIAIQDWLSANPFEGLKDVVIAYSSVSIYYDPVLVRRKNNIKSTAFEFIREKLETAFYESYVDEGNNHEIFRIPVCYSSDFGIDIHFLSNKNNISREEIIQLHTSKIYRVYMIGFLPGFPYLGKIDEKLTIERKANPIPVTAGSVGIAGNQTGIYPLNCPGGWQIIGRTPLKLFEANVSVPVMLHIGDLVQFYEIGMEEFQKFHHT